MRPVAVPCIFSMRRAGVNAADTAAATPPRGPASFMKDTCHVWAEDGPLWQGMTEGEPPPMQLPLRRRLRPAGLDPDEGPAVELVGPGHDALGLGGGTPSLGAATA